MKVDANMMFSQNPINIPTSEGKLYDVCCYLANMMANEQREGEHEYIYITCQQIAVNLDILTPVMKKFHEILGIGRFMQEHAKKWNEEHPDG